MVASILFTATALLGFVAAHPGHDVNAEAAQRAAGYAAMERRSLEHCAQHIKAREPQMIARRVAELEKIRAKRNIKRSFEDVLATNHHSNKTVTPDSPIEDIFGGNATCILQSETTEGPYYVSGEYIRTDVTEGQVGVDWVSDIQVVDINSCEVLPNVALEIWHTNATGVYGGVVSGGNGNTADATNINNTAFRGIQVSDSNGVLQFQSLIPGHYTGRTPHAHILAHHGFTKNANSTLTGGTISHVGQLFFDQDLYTAVQALSPYSANTQRLTTNAQDGIMAQEAATSDPVVNYVYIGSSVAEGIFSWITVGIDSTVSKSVKAAAYLDANGGHANAGGGGGFPGGPPPTGAPSTPSELLE